MKRDITTGSKPVAPRLLLCNPLAFTYLKFSIFNVAFIVQTDFYRI